MSFTYTNDPANSDRDAVRVMLDDTVEASEKLSDETIAWLLDSYSNVWFAGAAGAELIGGQQSAAVNMTRVGDLQITSGAGNIGGQYRDLAKRLREQGLRKGVAPYAGGISVADKESQEDDTDWDRTPVKLGIHDNPGNSSTGTGTADW